MVAEADWKQQVAENARRYQQLQDHLARLTLTETSRDGVVRLTVSSSGILTDLQLTERGQPRPLGQVATEIMECLRRAQARIPALLQNTIATTLGAEDPSTRLIVADARTRFPEPPPPAHRSSTVDELNVGAELTGGPSAPPPQPPPSPLRLSSPPVRRSGPTTEDDWDERQIMDDL